MVVDNVKKLGPQGWSMDWDQRGGPWTGSKGVVHGPGPKGCSMHLGSMFCIRPYSQDSATIDVIQIYRLLRSTGDRPQLLRGGGDNANERSYF